MCVRTSVRLEQLGSHRTGLIKFDDWIFFRIFVEKIQVSLKSDKNIGHFT